MGQKKNVLKFKKEWGVVSFFKYNKPKGVVRSLEEFGQNKVSVNLFNDPIGSEFTGTDIIADFNGLCFYPVNKDWELKMERSFAWSPAESFLKSIFNNVKLKDH